MSFDLIREDGAEFCFSNAGWRHVLALARAHGWIVVAGVDDDEPEQFTAEQALTLADAMDRAMGDGTAADVASRLSDRLTSLLVTPSESSMFRDDPIQVTERGVEHFRQFVCFGRGGAFVVS